MLVCDALSTVYYRRMPNFLPSLSVLVLSSTLYMYQLYQKVTYIQEKLPPHGTLWYHLAVTNKTNISSKPFTWQIKYFTKIDCNINHVISSAMDFAVAQKIIPENPCKAVALPKVEHKEMQTIPAEQLQAFLQEAKATGVYEMYYIELATGLRRGELLGLKWTDIDWKNGIIKVRRSIARVNGEIVESPLKTKNSYRAVSISPQAVEILKEQKKKTNDQYIFPSPNGGPISPDSVNNMLKRVLARAGIRKVRFHDLRHTFATIALQNGVDIKTVSGMLGHFSAGFTLDTYAHVTTSAQKEAAQTMGKILSE